MTAFETEKSSPSETKRNRTRALAYDPARVRVTASAYTCAPSVFCPACGAGLASPAMACAAARCPGMNDAFSANCSGRGVGADGGCRVVVSGKKTADEDDANANVSFVCACADGYEGEACESRVVGSVAGADARIKRETKTNEAETCSADAVVSASDGDSEADGDENKKNARAALAVTGVVILCVAVVLAVVSLVAAQRAARKRRARLEVERHIQNAAL